MTDYFPTIQGFTHSSEKHRSKHLGPLHPCCKRFGLTATLQIAYLNNLGLHSESTPPPWKRQPLSQLSPVPWNSPAQSSQQLPLPLWGMENLPAHLLHQGRQEHDSHLHHIYMGFGPGTAMGRNRGSLNTGIHLSTVPKQTACRLRFINNVIFSQTFHSSAAAFYPLLAGNLHVFCNGLHIRTREKQQQTLPPGFRRKGLLFPRTMLVYLNANSNKSLQMVSRF